MSQITTNLDTPAPLRILLVEDDEFDVAVFRRAFRKSEVPCEIIRCRRAEEALEGLQVTGLELDLLVTDHKLPGMAGLEMCKILLAEKPSFAVVLLTGGGSEEVAIEALKAGVHDYIVKDSGHEHLTLLPLVLPQAVQRHQDHVARKKAERRLRASQDAAFEARREQRTRQGVTGEQINRSLDAMQQELTDYISGLDEPLTENSPLWRLRQGQATLKQLLHDLADDGEGLPPEEKPERQPFDLGEAVRSALDSLVLPPDAEARDLFFGLATEVPDRVLGDRQRLQEMIVRLIDSLLRQSSGGDISVDVRPHTPEGWLRFDIGGDFLVMPQRERQRLMAAFNLSEEETMVGALSVEWMQCRDLARWLSGNIWVEADSNAEEDDQTLLCFSAELPAVQGSQFRLRDPSGETSWWDASDDGARIGRQRLTPPVLEVDRHPAQVLIVTANPLISHVIGRMLEQSGCRYVPVDHGRQALQALEREPFDLMLSSFEMPDMDGDELTRQIRQAEEHRQDGSRLPIIALGPEAEQMDVCRKAGMDGLIARPITLRRVERAVRRALREKI